MAHINGRFLVAGALLIQLNLLVFLGGCKRSQKPYAFDENPPFEVRQSLGIINDNLLNEISGIVASRRYPGFFWVHNDSGGEAAVYLINSKAEKIAQVKVEGLQNRDWEDIAIGPGNKGGHDLLYIAETGDNRAAYGTYYIYIFEEPGVDLDNRTQRLFIDEYETYTYQYPDGARDAETLLVDPLNQDIWIISKREPQVNVYRLPSAGRGTNVYTLEKTCSIPFHEIVGGEISSDGTELLLKNYLSVFYWSRGPEEGWAEVLERAPVVLPYSPEPQGEAIAFTNSGNGYVTISEAENLAGKQYLYFYKRAGFRDAEVINLD